MTWVVKEWGELTLDELYGLLRLRQRVFVQEQNCPYVDCDGADDQALHLWAVAPGGERPAARSDEDAVARGGEHVPEPVCAGLLQPAAYARLFAPGVKYREASIGRVVTAPEHRRSGLGRALLGRAVEVVEARFGPSPIKIQAQRYLLEFYRSFGFRVVSGEYLEDGIVHVDMIRDGTVVANPH
jgi:ElaA protein